MKQGELTRSGKRRSPVEKRFLAALLALVMALALLPATALAATGSVIQLGTGGIQAGDRVYFGTYAPGGVNYDIPWMVVNSEVFSGTSTATGTNVLPLLSNYMLGTSLFRDVSRGYYNYDYDNVTYESSVSPSTLQIGMGTLDDDFNPVERNAIADTTLSGASMYAGQGDLEDQKLFPLSSDGALALGADAARIAKDRITRSPDRWWLRSSNNHFLTHTVNSDGVIQNSNFPVHRERGVRPAFNLKLNSVLFTSAAVDGKSVNAVGSNLNQISTTAPTTGWKLTLKDYDGDGDADGDRDSFAITTTTLSAASAAVSYSNAKTGTNEYISAMIVDAGTAT